MFHSVSITSVEFLGDTIYYGSSQGCTCVTKIMSLEISHTPGLITCDVPKFLLIFPLNNNCLEFLF